MQMDNHKKSTSSDLNITPPVHALAVMAINNAKDSY